MAAGGNFHALPGCREFQRIRSQIANDRVDHAVIRIYHRAFMDDMREINLFMLRVRREQGDVIFR